MLLCSHNSITRFWNVILWLTFFVYKTKLKYLFFGLRLFVYFSENLLIWSKKLSHHQMVYVFFWNIFIENWIIDYKKINNVIINDQPITIINYIKKNRFFLKNKKKFMFKWHDPRLTCKNIIHLKYHLESIDEKMYECNKVTF